MPLRPTGHPSPALVAALSSLADALNPSPTATARMRRTILLRAQT